MNGRKSNPNQNNVPESVGKFIGGAMGLIFSGIGLTVLIFLWGAPFDEFGSPPLFFRVFGSFIALAFVLVGGGTFLGILLSGNVSGNRPSAMSDSPEEGAADGALSQPEGALQYRCPNCGAPLEGDLEVSPHGDAKCMFCKGWFNIHGK